MKGDGSGRKRVGGGGGRIGNGNGTDAARRGPGGRPGPGPLTATVLGDAVRRGVPLWVFCEACSHNVEMNAGDLADRLGYDFPVPSLKGRLCCSRCGSRDAAVRVQYASPGLVARHGPRKRD
ncbi:hypothetical protein ACFOGJ_07500 [Marinibaculum pumilum]|uniref:Hydrogenase maturation nickel metallochaperone HypA n=1 Tax=Marinibaculum pumilum TaxID=1766165 RepID=A0ABV7KXF8_9PROT